MQPRDICLFKIEHPVRHVVGTAKFECRAMKVSGETCSALLVSDRALAFAFS